MKVLRTLAFAFVTMSLLLAACAPAATPAPTEAPVVTQAPTQAATEAPTTAATEAPTTAATEAATQAPAANLTCANPIKVGLITDASGALAIYGAHILRSFMLGMEYATGVTGSAGEKFDFTQTQQNNFKMANCE